MTYAPLPPQRTWRRVCSIGRISQKALAVFGAMSSRNAAVTVTPPTSSSTRLVMAISSLPSFRGLAVEPSYGDRLAALGTRALEGVEEGRAVPVDLGNGGSVDSPGVVAVLGLPV